MKYFADKRKVDAGIKGSEFKVRREPSRGIENRYVQPSFPAE